MKPCLQFHAVGRTFAGRPVLNGLNLQVAPGQVFALLGRNGAGKTTALRILLGFLAPTRGSCELLGEDSRSLSSAIRQRVAYVAEGHALYSWMSVQQALSFEAQTRQRFDHQKAKHYCQRTHLDLSATIRDLSRGQRAQLALLIATAANPEVLVLDDPAMGLDPAVRRELLEVLIDLLADTGAAVLFSTHILSDVERIADRVGILHGGSLLVDAELSSLSQRLSLHRIAQAPTAQLGTRIPRLLGVRERSDGQEWLLADSGPDTDRALRELGVDPALGSHATLEDLFLLLTSRPAAERMENPS